MRIPFVLVWNGIRAIFTTLFLVFWGIGRLFQRKRRWVLVKVPERLALVPNNSLSARLRGQSGNSWFEWRDNLRKLADDKAVAGVVFDLDRSALTFSDAERLDSVLARMRERDTRTVAWAHSYNVRRYTLAARMDQVLTSPPAAVELLGMHVELFFLSRLMDRFGVAAQFVHIGAYKTAAHRFIKRAATPEQLENMQRLLDGLAQSAKDAVSKSRGPECGAEMFAHGPMSAAQAERVGLIDAVVYGDGVPAVVTADGSKAKLVQEKQWSFRPEYRWSPPLRRKKQVAVVDMTGIIGMGDEGSPLMGSRSVSYRKYARVLRQLERNRRVKAVVLAINSPGGSAVASDLLWRECVRLAAKKPVVAVMTDVAASGGYYIAVAAHRIFASETTMTGSIGVVAGRMALGGVLQHLDIHHEAVSQGEWAGFHDPLRPLDRVSMARLRASAREVYRRFVDRVAFGREMSRSAVHDVAEGRVWLGKEAVANGLVDEIGTVDDAIRAAASQAGMKEGAYAVTTWPRRDTGFGRLRKRGAVLAPPAATVKQAALGLLPPQMRVISAFAQLLRTEDALTFSPPAAALQFTSDGDHGCFHEPVSEMRWTMKDSHNDVL